MALETSPAGTHDPWFVIDRTEQAGAGSFASPASAIRWITTNRLWDHPRGPLDLVPQSAGTVIQEAAVCPVGVARERIPAFLDVLDVQLALWIGQSVVASDDAA
jgi:hypothetical protein